MMGSKINLKRGDNIICLKILLKKLSEVTAIEN